MKERINELLESGGEPNTTARCVYKLILDTLVDTESSLSEPYGISKKYDDKQTTYPEAKVKDLVDKISQVLGEEPQQAKNISKLAVKLIEKIPTVEPLVIEMIDVCGDTSYEEKSPGGLFTATLKRWDNKYKCRFDPSINSDARIEIMELRDYQEEGVKKGEKSDLLIALGTGLGKVSTTLEHFSDDTHSSLTFLS